MNPLLSSELVTFDAASISARIADFNLLWLDQAAAWVQSESDLARTAGVSDYGADVLTPSRPVRDALSASGRPLVACVLQTRNDLDRALAWSADRLLHPRIVRLNAAFLRLIVDVVRWDIPTASAGFGVGDFRLSTALATLSDEHFASLIQGPLLMRPRFAGAVEFRRFMSALTQRADADIIRMEALFVAGIAAQQQEAVNLDQ